MLFWIRLLALLVLWAWAVGSGSPFSCYNDRPIIGILTQPTEGELRQYGTARLQAGMVRSGVVAHARVFEHTACSVQVM